MPWPEDYGGSEALRLLMLDQKSQSLSLSLCLSTFSGALSLHVRSLATWSHHAVEPTEQISVYLMIQRQRVVVEEPCCPVISYWSPLILVPGTRANLQGGSSPTHHLTVTTGGTLRENPPVCEVIINYCCLKPLTFGMSCYVTVADIIISNICLVLTESSTVLGTWWRVPHWILTIPLRETFSLTLWEVQRSVQGHLRADDSLNWGPSAQPLRPARAVFPLSMPFLLGSRIASDVTHMLCVAQQQRSRVCKPRRGGWGLADPRWSLPASAQTPTL